MTETVALHYDPFAHTITTKWGEITESTPKKIPGKPGHVIVGTQCLANVEFIDELLATGPVYANECICSASVIDGQTFFHLVAENGNWTYLLHPAVWTDGGGPNDLYLGVFPD